MLAERLLQFFAKSYCIAGRMSADVVIEVGEDRPSLPDSASEPHRPVVQHVIVVSAAVPYGTVKPGIHEGTDHAPPCGGSRHVVKTARDLVPNQKREDFVGIPAGIAKFDYVALTRRKD